MAERIKLFIKTSIALIFIVGALGACDDVTENLLGDCDCPSTNPWSVPGGDTCYPSESDCQANESGDCQLCD